MTDTLKISVIIPCYNAADTIKVQLQALSRQNFSEPWEVILSDNGSTDDSKAIAMQYGANLPNFRIIDSSGIRGPAYARNQGAIAAKGESLIFCDADDEVGNDWLPAMARALESNDFVTCRFDPHKLNDSRTIKSRMCPQQNGLQTYDYPPFLPHAASAGIGIKRWIHGKIGGFDETMPMLEDTDYCWRVQLMGINLVFAGDAILHYRMRMTVPRMLRQSRLWGEYNVYLYKKYRSCGMQKLSRRKGLISTWRLLKRMPKSMLDSNKRVPWLWQFAWQFGRILGSAKYRVFAL